MDVPGCGRGYLGPGGLDDGGRYANCTGGAAGYIDRVVFGEHMYKTPVCHKLYETQLNFDPEGILGTLTSVLTVYMGVQAGRTLNTYQNVKAKVVRWTIWGLVAVSRFFFKSGMFDYKTFFFRGSSEELYVNFVKMMV